MTVENRKSQVPREKEMMTEIALVSASKQKLMIYSNSHFLKRLKSGA